MEQKGKGDEDKHKRTFLLNCSKCDAIGPAEATLNSHYLFEKDACAYNVYYT
jgi:hypothetical protein